MSKLSKISAIHGNRFLKTVASVVSPIVTLPVMMSNRYSMDKKPGSFGGGGGGVGGGGSGAGTTSRSIVAEV